MITSSTGRKMKIGYKFNLKYFFFYAVFQIRINQRLEFSIEDAILPSIPILLFNTKAKQESII